MLESKNTKKAFYSSIMVMLVCLAMLIGTTFAWFTDSVVSGANKIVAGNLDVELEYATGFDETTGKATWAPVTSDVKLFSNYEKDGTTLNLWEPGHTEVVYLKVKNVGSLALKYKFAVNVLKETTATNRDGNTIKLSEHLVFGQVESATEIPKYTRREDAWAAAGDTKGLGEFTKENPKLMPNAEEYVALVVYMPTTVGDEANSKSKRKKASIDLGITLTAIQTPQEKDSFDEYYDDGLVAPATGNTDFETQMNNATAGDTIKTAPGTYKLPTTVPEGVTVSGEGPDKTILQVPAVGEPKKKTGLIVDQPNVTISNAEVERSDFLGNGEYYGLIDIREGGTTLDNIKIDKIYFSNNSAVVIQNGVNEGETVTIKNSNIEGYYKAITITDGVNGTVEIDNCEITGTYTFNVNSANSENLVVNVKDTKLHGWTSYGNIKSASFTNTEFSQGDSDYNYLRPYADTTLTNCTFAEGFKLGTGDAGNTFTINNCTYNGQKLTAENIQSLILDEEEKELLSQCTIIVDGVTVVMQ